MSRLRQNAATKEWVLFATERARRPEDHLSDRLVKTSDLAEHKVDCPFCPGNEEDPALETYRAEDPGGDWKVRCLPNLYPAVSPGELNRIETDPFARELAGVGHHEVLVESRAHNTTLALMPQADVLAVLSAWRDRCAALRALPATKHLVVFKNHRPEAGCSLEHPHSQIVSLPVAPWGVVNRMQEAQRYQTNFDECVFCQMVVEEREAGSRIVAERDGFLAFVPFAAYTSCSTYILPKVHSGCFAECSDQQLEGLAGILKEVLARIYHGLGDPPFNLVIRTAPRTYCTAAFAHWYITLVPRLARSAGFEIGTGMHINTSLPEDDASYLRGITLPGGIW
jgi:UDPglucose--hexose-1-phosphate uridylyltransferase